jgi:hypothetical protein
MARAGVFGCAKGRARRAAATEGTDRLKHGVQRCDGGGRTRSMGGAGAARRLPGVLTA